MRFTIKLKLFLTFAFMLAVLIGTAAYGILSLGGLNTTLGDVLNGPAERLKLAQTLNNLQLQQIRQQKNMLSSANPTETNRYIALSDEARKEFDTTFQEVLSKATEQGKVLWNKLDGFTKDFRRDDDACRRYRGCHPCFDDRRPRRHQRDRPAARRSRQARGRPPERGASGR
jgi:methyl-accepting chemotaxis protein